jgi:hypothetical protein
MPKQLKTAKAETTTIRIRADTKEKAIKLFEKTKTASTFASFLGDMVLLGVQVEEIVHKQRNPAIQTVAVDKKRKNVEKQAAHWKDKSDRLMVVIQKRTNDPQWGTCYTGGAGPKAIVEKRRYEELSAAARVLGFNADELLDGTQKR